MSNKADLIRMKQEYADRKTRLDKIHLYSRFTPAYLYAMQHRERDLLKLLNHNLEFEFSQKAILEIGCGSGGVLLEYLVNRADPNHLFGLDILLDRLYEAKLKIPEASILNANGENIPFENASFDLVFQYTAFSSILDDTIKKNMAQEMLRVLKPNGLIIWYDFWLNPTNNQTKGIKLQKSEGYFQIATLISIRSLLLPHWHEELYPYHGCSQNFLNR